MLQKKNLIVELDFVFYISNDFISDFQVKTWHVESKIDFEKMTDRPTFKSMQLLQ